MSTERFPAEPAIARWELWSVASMMASTHGSEAETVVADKIANAVAQENEADEIVWRGVFEQLAAMRAAKN